MDSGNPSNSSGVDHEKSNGNEIVIPIKPLPPNYPVSKPLKGLLKPSQSADSSVDESGRSQKHVKFSDTMMVFCDDWPEEMMPQLITLNPPTNNFNLFELVASGLMFDPPVEYQDLQQFDPPPDYQDCVTSILCDKSTGITFIDEDGMPCEADYERFGSALQWENILNESELREEDIIGVLKEDEILQAIGSQTTDIDTVFHPPFSEEDALDEGDFPVHYQINDLSREDKQQSQHRSGQNNVDRELNSNINGADSNCKKYRDNRLDKSGTSAESNAESSETLSECDDTSSDIASDSSFTSQDTIILTTPVNGSTKSNNSIENRSAKDSFEASQSPKSYSVVDSNNELKPSEYRQIDVNLDYEPQLSKPVLETINDDGDEDEGGKLENTNVCHEQKDEPSKPREGSQEIDRKQESKVADCKNGLNIEINSQECQGTCDIDSQKGFPAKDARHNPNAKHLSSHLPSELEMSQKHHSDRSETKTSSGDRKFVSTPSESVTLVLLSNRQNSPQSQSDQSNSPSFLLSASTESAPSDKTSVTVSNTASGGPSNSLSVSAIRRTFEKKEPVYENTASDTAPAPEVRSRAKGSTLVSKRPKSFPFAMGKNGDDSKSANIIKEATNVMTGKLKWISLSDDKNIKHTGEKKNDGKHHSLANIAKEISLNQNKDINDNSTGSNGNSNKIWKKDFIVEYSSEPRRKEASGNFPQRPDQPSSSGSSTASSSSISTPPSSDKIQENESKDELVQFVENDIQRIERLKRRYSLSDEGDDPTFGFGRRPLVRGIKPRYGTTDEIIRHMQMQLQPSIPSQPVVAPQNTPRQAIVIDTQALSNHIQTSKLSPSPQQSISHSHNCQLSSKAQQLYHQHLIPSFPHSNPPESSSPNSLPPPHAIPQHTVRHVYLLPQNRGGPRYIARSAQLASLSPRLQLANNMTLPNPGRVRIVCGPPARSPVLGEVLSHSSSTSSINPTTLCRPPIGHFLIQRSTSSSEEIHQAIRVPCRQCASSPMIQHVINPAYMARPVTVSPVPPANSGQAEQAFCKP